MEKRQKKIIVAIDGSPTSQKAMRVGGEFAAIHNSELVLLYVVEPVPNLFEFFAEEELNEKRRSWGIRMLDAAKKAYDGPEVEISEMIVTGRPYKMICEAAEEILAEMIVIGAYGSNAEGTGMVGTNVQKLIRTAKVPVVTVPDYTDGVQFGKILMPVDIEFGAIELERFLYEYHKVYNPVVEMLAIVRREDDLEETEQYLAKQKEMLIKAGLKDVITKTLLGTDPAKEILNYVDENGHDIIWMETHGRKGLAGWFFGSVTGEILNATLVPVLSLHPEREPLHTHYYHKNLPV
jgi:nucleotide-binding universal stress UspA family protein